MAWFRNLQSKFWSALSIGALLEYHAIRHTMKRVTLCDAASVRSCRQSPVRPACDYWDQCAGESGFWVRGVLRSNLITSSSDSLTQPVCLCLSGICEIQLFCFPECRAPVKPKRWDFKSRLFRAVPCSLSLVAANQLALSSHTKATVTADLDIWALYNSKPLTNLLRVISASRSRLWMRRLVCGHVENVSRQTT